ncbi:MAG: ATP-binding protein [Ramlibacter sp.]|nr:ATP-binding protein [Ramlibacter sp.]
MQAHSSHNAPGVDLRSLALAACFLAAYALLDWASYIRPFQGLNITPWNPQPAVAIALLVYNRRWFWLVVVGVVASEVIVRGWPGEWVPALASALALALTYAAVARALLQRTDLRRPLASRTALGWFIGVVTIGALFDAVFYVFAHSVENTTAGAVVRYWVGDAVGILVTLPLLMMAMNSASRAELLGTLRAGSFWTGVIASMLLLWFVFGRGEQDYFKYFYLLLLPVVWASARFGLAGAVLASGVTQLGLIAAAQLALRHDLTLFELQALMAASTMIALLVGSLVDERERAAAELRATLKSAAAGQMAAALAHELSQPLTALNNYARAAGMLAQGGQLNPARSDQLPQLMASIARETQRAGDIVRRLRDFFKSGATSLQRISPGRSVAEVVESHVAYAKQMGVDVHLEFPSDMPWLLADPVQLGVVLRNLIANAIESASLAPDGRQVTIRIALVGEGVLIEVLDSGRGIDAGRLETVFDTFPSAKAGGLGVGLSICRALVNAHGGKLWAVPGPGGHFSLLLPVDHDSRTAEPTS